ncbi:conserved hypothetical protein [Aspergillus terreus NIH2624]|uniref:Zn(2)-C6 fungal-type domain-containing protein n=1 Tax=Aspergillus terreus (strain NIH 2624 / FGSC A1156) TaxID=341663 RepID=Q0CAD8_ASPTN|nr:uncharacterized protein ATEG_09346 [Aspergillus terreus NIH2624]EAU30483.1 conserved hypothetical protein [Aspergillus terreus NIH2624]
MVLIAYFLQALTAYILSAATFGLSFLAFGGQQQQHQQLTPHSQIPLEGPGCDGSGIVDPDGRCNGDGLIDDPQPPGDKYREGFRFENPSTDCKYVSQMYIWDSFKTLEKDMSKLFTLIHKNVSFTVVGHHPIAGHYNDLMHFYVNALRRVAMIFSLHEDKFRIHPQAIHGGCNYEWSVAEIEFIGQMNSGEPFDIVNVWKLPRVSSQQAMTEPPRKRSRIACVSCQSRKRKCSGDQPCSTCSQFGVDCHYDLQSRKKKDPRTLMPHLGSLGAKLRDDSASKGHSHAPLGDSNGIHLSSLEANSGAAFVRRLGLKIDPANAPNLHLFAWNVGARHPSQPTLSSTIGRPTPVVDIISQEDMRSLATVFFEKVDPCYGFIDRDSLFNRVSKRWLPPSSDAALAYGPYDAVLCGVAAFGYLFSQRQATPTEIQLVENARQILEPALLSETTLSVDVVMGWVLRVAYLRMTASPYAAWMTSCSLMHMIEATGLHLEPSSDTILEQHSTEPCDPDIRRRLFGMARHLNVWISFELGRSRVVLHGATSLPPTPRPTGYTTEIFNLLPVSESLDPNSTTQDLPDLESALTNVLDVVHIQPPLILAQCNLMLCIYRRLRALNSVISGTLLDRVLALAQKGLQAAREMVASNCPWHQAANVPFQVVCTLLAIDNRASLAMLGDAMRTLREVASAYDTEVMREAYNTAYLLILLHQRRKEEDTRSLGNVLRDANSNPSSSSAPQVVAREPFKESTHSLADYPGFSWLSDLVIDMPSLQNFDMDNNLVNDDTSSLPTAGI